jgi:hypothetical protein
VLVFSDKFSLVKFVVIPLTNLVQNFNRASIVYAHQLMQIGHVACTELRFQLSITRVLR